MLDKPKDVWASGALYEAYVGRWSRLVAREFLKWLNVPAQSCWLDVGCGTGALCEIILKTAKPQAVKGVDPSAGFVEYARAQARDDRVQFKVGNAQELKEESSVYDAAVAGLVLNFVPQPDRAIEEMHRVVKNGGTVAAYVWDYAGEMQLMRHFWNAAVALDEHAHTHDEGERFPICKPEPLAQLFHTAGLREVETHTIDVPTVFRDFDDYWSPFLGGQGPAPAYAMSLSEERRAALREKIRTSLPAQSDGSIHLIARAWGVRGTK